MSHAPHHRRRPALSEALSKALAEHRKPRGILATALPGLEGEKRGWTEIPIASTAGRLEVWIEPGGEVEIYLLDGSGRASRMLAEIVGNAGHIAEMLTTLGLVDREAKWYAGEIWRLRILAPRNIERRRKRYGRVDLPTPPVLWGNPARL